jgi:putative flippase GtrA
MIAIKYTLFAMLSTLVNLLFQYLSFLVYTDFASLYVAMFIGTIAGLLIKYSLDKKFIFYHKPKGKVDDTKKFIRYTIMGIFTTVIFWGTEVSFDLYFEAKNAKYVGAVTGLSMGYIIKYFLDKKFVFKHLNI